MRQPSSLTPLQTPTPPKQQQLTEREKMFAEIQIQIMQRFRKMPEDES